MSAVLVLRADATFEAGTGHVMRCLALAQAWQATGGEAVFLSAELPPPLEARLTAESIAVQRLATTPGSRADGTLTHDAIGGLDAEWLAVDGYHFGKDFHTTLRSVGEVSKLVIDDMGFAGPSDADVLLNQNAYADEALYPGVAGRTRLLLGTRYVLLRSEFVRAMWEDAPVVARRVAVSLGGSDPAGATLTVIEALSRLRDLDLEVTVLIGAAARDAEEVEKAARRCAARTRIEQNVDNMAWVLDWADVAICAAGSVTWEICFMGVPSLLIVTAPNQEPIATALSRTGVAFYAGFAQALDPALLAEQIGALLADRVRRRAMSLRARDVVDGRGGRRVVAAMHEISRGVGSR